MKAILFCLALGGMGGGLLAQHENHHSEAPVERPLVFLDKSPKIVAYQLKRLSNEQLLLVERKTSDPKYIPVYEAILTRRGILPKYRQEASASLAVLKKSSVPAELVAGIARTEALDAGVRNELAKLLTALDSRVLADAASALEASTSLDSTPASEAAFAALLIIRDPASVWESAKEKPERMARLLGGIPLVPDAARRSSLASRVEALLRPETDPLLLEPAVRAAGSMRQEMEKLFGDLSALIAQGKAVASAARAIASLPRESWPRDQVQPLANSLLAEAKKFPEAERVNDDFLDVTQLGSELASQLPSGEGRALAREFRSVGIRVLRLKTLHEQMFFDKTTLVVEAGQRVQVILENTDTMQHNWVLVNPGALEKIGAEADKMTPAPDITGLSFVPRSPDVLAAMSLLNSGDVGRVTFTAPARPDKYPYACTFPGHWQRMRGTLLVVSDLEDYLKKNSDQPAEPTITEWKLEMIEPALSQLGTGRDLEKGRALFASAGCAGCHKSGTEGVLYGPELTRVFEKYQGKPAAVLAEILEPSKTIEPRYRPFNFEPENGEPFTGFVLQEDADTWTVQTGPGEGSIKKIQKKEIKSRQAQQLSIMPAGLLNVLKQDEVLDLLAFLKSAGAGK